MKKTVYIYCGDDSAGAKALANSLRNGETRVFLHAASGFVGVADPRCSQALVMIDVPLWRQDRIHAAYGQTKGSTVNFIEAPAEMAIPPHSGTVDHSSGLSVQHRGFGRWYVMRGDEIISGPHTKEQAQGLAA